MKIKTKLKNKPCLVNFAYETWNGCYCEYFGNYDEAEKNSNGYSVSLTGFLNNYYYGCNERIDYIDLKNKPTTAEVKQFIKECYRIVEA